MKYIILANSQIKKGEKVALVDRELHKDIWWTELIEKAKVFDTFEEAQKRLKPLKFNSPKIYPLEKGKTRLGQVITFHQVSSLSRLFDEKQCEWHDDDWHE